MAAARALEVQPAALDAGQALAVFERLPQALRAPSLDPRYVCADAVRSRDAQAIFFVFERAGQSFYHAFHAERVKDTEFIDVQSPYGYGGPIASTMDAGFLTEAWRAYGAWCAEHRVLAEFVRFHPLLENWRFFDGDVVQDRETVWIDLAVPDVLESYEVRVRTAVRKAQKSGLRVEWWDAPRMPGSFPALYHAAMQALQASDFYHFPDGYFERLAAMPGLRYAVCLFEGEPVAAALFLVGPRIMEYHLSASDARGKKLGATNLILHEAAQLGRAEGCAQLHLGGGTNADPSNSLLFFKSGFSSRRAHFRIGRRVHDAAGYSRLKDAWRERFGAVGSRVLFYRN